MPELNLEGRKVLARQERYPWNRDGCSWNQMSAPAALSMLLWPNPTAEGKDVRRGGELIQEKDGLLNR